MANDRFDQIDDETLDATAPEQDIDFDNDQIDVRDVTDDDGEVEDQYPDDHGDRIENADLDNATDELVDICNGRDLDGLSDLLAPDAEAEFLGGRSRQDVVDGFGDLFIRYPTLLMTRADLGSEPIVALWTFDYEADGFDPFGFLFFEMSEDQEGLLGRISYADEIPDSDELVVETPERGDLPEWEEWSETDED